jgi:hypothetical protein
MIPTYYEVRLHLNIPQIEVRRLIMCIDLKYRTIEQA